MKIVFFGSDDFALAGLQALLKSPHKVVACVTHPDRPKGRHYILASSPIKEETKKSNLPLYQPATLEDVHFAQELEKFKADLFVVIAYGQYISRRICEIPRKMCINLHASLLPKYRGAAPINWAIVNGEKTTGVSVIQVGEKMDCGDIIAQREISIEDNEDAPHLRLRLIKVGVELLIETIESINKDTYTLTKQDDRKATYAPKLSKKDGCIDWRCDACFIHNMVRGFLPWPSAYTYWKGKMLKILKSEVLGEKKEETKKPGTVIDVSGKGIVVATGKGSLLLKRVHLESSKPMDSVHFIAGHKLSVGQELNGKADE